MNTQTEKPAGSGPAADMVLHALHRAWVLGQTYWQQADADFCSEHKKADVTLASFTKLVADTKELMQALALHASKNLAPTPTPKEPMVVSIRAMFDKFGLTYEGPARHLSSDEKQFRLVCLTEETIEYREAKTKADEFDALVDLLVFTIGTMLRQGFPIEAGFNRVMAANMLKRRAMARTESKRDFELDLIKPAGWTSPDLSDLTGDSHASK